MGELITNAHWNPAPPDTPSQYARMIPGLSAMPPPATGRGRQPSTHSWREKNLRHIRPAKLAEALLPHPIAEPFYLYRGVAADFISLAFFFTAQKLFLPRWSLSLCDLPLLAVLVTLFGFTEGIYAEDAYSGIHNVIPRLARSVLVAITLVFIADRGQVRLAAILVTTGSGFAALLLCRYLSQCAWARRSAEDEVRNVLIVGGGPAARSIARTLCSDPLRHAYVCGSVDDDLPLSATVLGRIADLDWLARAEFIDEVILALPGSPAQAREAADAAFRNHLDIRAVPDLPAGYWPDADVDFIGDVPVVTLHREPVPSTQLFFKRLLDSVSAAAALALFSPVMAIVALLIRIDSRGPVINAAERAGAKGRPFRCFKFRSMVSDADNLKADLRRRNQRQGPIFKIVGDPRITRIGGFIRRYSLDELPQLWNVLLCDMSMVGPRPHPVDEVNRYELHHYRRLDMKPGITGLWQITARHSPSFELNMHLDLTYIENWSLRLDLRILLGTFRVLFAPEGA